jgi:diadenosine tetraphosphate (Ap4A) HIT family hydrolase
MGFSDAGLDHKEARTEEQKKLMAEIEADGVCPFCEAHFRKYHPKPILKETVSWFFTENMSPYEGTTHHYIFVYKPTHIRFPSELTAEARVELFDLIDWAVKEYHIPGGGFFMRFGEGGYNGSSVEHLHGHLISGVEKSEETEGLKVKLSYKKITF